MKKGLLIAAILFPSFCWAQPAASDAPAQPAATNAPAAPLNWADAKEDLGLDESYAKSQALCNALRHKAPPAADMPDAATRASLKGCNSAKLYYGIGMPADAVRARQCAFTETTDDDDVFTGATMLMTIYANGQGAKRDLDVATALACVVEGAPAEIDGRLHHLQELKKTHWQGNDFSFCDDITSGLGMSNCSWLSARMRDDKRDQQLKAIAAGLNPQQQQQLAALIKLADSYADASSDEEVNAIGTDRGALSIDQSQQLKDDFSQALLQLLQNKITPVSTDGLKAADKRLNSLYQKVMHTNSTPEDHWDGAPPDALPDTTVSHSGVRKTQRTWLRYRDSFIQFAQANYPQASADGLNTLLIQQRSKLLKALLQDD